MSDTKIIDEMVALWIENGGDAEGFVWCSGKILEKLREREKSDE